jgi:hypothetical protein
MDTRIEYDVNGIDHTEYRTRVAASGNVWRYQTRWETTRGSIRHSIELVSGDVTLRATHDFSHSWSIRRADNVVLVSGLGRTEVEEAMLNELSELELNPFETVTLAVL